MSSRSLFLFRRDLRLSDNTALNEALRLGNPVLAVFVVDPSLMKRWQDSDRRLAFLFQTLKQLRVAVSELGGTLLVASGKPEKVLPALIDRFKVDKIFVNRGYSPFGRSQD